MHRLMNKLSGLGRPATAPINLIRETAPALQEPPPAPALSRAQRELENATLGPGGIARALAGDSASRQRANLASRHARQAAGLDAQRSNSAAVTHQPISKDQPTANEHNNNNELSLNRNLNRQESPTDKHEDAIKLIFNCKNNSAKHLPLVNFGLTHLPPEVSTFNHLTHLDLQQNQLNALPEDIGRLRNLVHLHVNDNRLTFIPNSIGSLQNLKTLYAQNNLLTAAPASLHKLKNLAYLQLQNNLLNEIPENFDSLPSTALVRIQDNDFQKSFLKALNKKMRRAPYIGPVYCIGPGSNHPPELLGGDNFERLTSRQKIEFLLQLSTHQTATEDPAQANHPVPFRGMHVNDCLTMALDLAIDSRPSYIAVICKKMLAEIYPRESKILVKGVYLSRDTIQNMAIDPAYSQLQIGSPQNAIEVEKSMRLHNETQNVHRASVQRFSVQQLEQISKRVPEPISIQAASTLISSHLRSDNNPKNAANIRAALRGLDTVTRRTEPLSEFNASPAKALAVLCTYIENTHDTIQCSLRDSLKARLVEIGNSSVCGVGMIERLIDVPTAIDWSITPQSISLEQLHMEITKIAANVNEEYEAMFGAEADFHRAAAEAANDTVLLGDIEERINTIKRDMFEARAQVELVLLRNVDKQLVQNQIDNIFPQGEGMRIRM